MELYQVQQLLESEEMEMRDYMRSLYSDRTIRTAERKHLAFKEFVEKIPNPVLKRLTALGSDVLSKFDRIANSALGDIRNAVRELPSLPVSTDKDVEKYLGELDSKLLEHRKLKRKGKPLHKDEKLAAKMATNAVLNYIRSSGLKTSAEKRNWLTRVMGWVMEAEAISGTLRAGRISIPEGTLARRGRPPKKKSKSIGS